MRLVTSALRMMKVSLCVEGLGGALLSGPSAPGSGPVCEGVDRGEASRPPKVSIIRLPLSRPSAPGGRLVLWGSLGTAPAPAGEHPEVPHQCPRMGLGVDEDGPPLS